MSINYNQNSLKKLQKIYEVHNSDINRPLTTLDSHWHSKSLFNEKLIPNTIAKIIRPPKESGEIKVSRLIELSRLAE